MVRYERVAISLIQPLMEDHLISKSQLKVENDKYPFLFCWVLSFFHFTFSHLCVHLCCFFFWRTKICMHLYHPQWVYSTTILLSEHFCILFFWPRGFCAVFLLMPTFFHAVVLLLSWELSCRTTKVTNVVRIISSEAISTDLANCSYGVVLSPAPLVDSRIKSQNGDGLTHHE